MPASDRPSDAHARQPSDHFRTSLVRDEIGQLNSEGDQEFVHAGQRGEESDLQTCLLLTQCGEVLSMENRAESRTGNDLAQPDLRQAVMYIIACVFLW